MRMYPCPETRSFESAARPQPALFLPKGLVRWQMAPRRRLRLLPTRIRPRLFGGD